MNSETNMVSEQNNDSTLQNSDDSSEAEINDSENVSQGEVNEAASIEQNDEVEGSRGYMKRINKLTARNKHSEETIRQLSQRIEYLNRSTANPNVNSTSPHVSEDNDSPAEPDENDYSDPKAYTKAYAKWMKKSFEHDAKKLQMSQALMQRDKYLKYINANHDKRLQEGFSRYDDFEEVISDIDMLPIDLDNQAHNEIINTIKESPMSADIVYYLGKNLDDGQSILELPIKQALIKLGKIEAKIESNLSQPIQSDTAPPPKQIHSNPSTISVKEDFDSFRKRLRTRR